MQKSILLSTYQFQICNKKENLTLFFALDFFFICDRGFFFLMIFKHNDKSGCLY